MNESNLSDEALAELLTLTMEVDECGTTIYRNHLGQIHRVLGPAVIFLDGTKKWLQNDQLHRTDGPAVIYADGDMYWYLDDEVLSHTEREWNERIKSM